MNRDNYMDGTVDHQTFYLAVAEAIGRPALERIVLSVAPLDKLRSYIVDPHLNNIRLSAWDAKHFAVRQLVATNARAVMAVSWSARAVQPETGTFCWSLCESVCVLKAVARDMAARADLIVTD